MNTKTQDMPPVPDANHNFELIPELFLERSFNASVERVWKAWTQSEQIKQWWGPKNYSCPEAKIDFVVHGEYLLAMKGPDGKMGWSGGTFEKIVPNKKIIFTDSFCDENGNPISASAAGMSGNWPETTTIRIEFMKISEDETSMSLTHLGIPEEMRDDCKQGWNSSFDKFKKLVEKH